MPMPQTCTALPQDLRRSESTSSISSRHAELGLHSIALLEQDFSLVFGNSSGDNSQPPRTSDLATPPVTEDETEEEHAARLHAEDLPQSRLSSIGTRKTCFPGLTST